MHLLIDGYGGDAARLWDAEELKRFLDEYPLTLNMTKLCEPQVLTYEGPKVEDHGVSGFVVIAESHISFHTFPNRGYVNIDVFSCKSFDSEKVIRDVRGAFRPIRREDLAAGTGGWSILERGGEASARAAD